MRPDPFGTAAAAAGAVPNDGELTTSPGAATGSPLARLRTAYGRRRQEAELYLPVPGWEEALVARVTIPHDDALKQIGGEVGTAEWTSDFVAAAVAGLYTVDGADDDGSPRLEPLPGVTGPLRFDHEFGDAIGAPDVRTPRAAVLAAFTRGGDDAPPVLNVLELADFAAKIERWLTDTSREIAEAIVPGR